jgi:glycosyltransferase involved in cell wall biosynthesis
METLTFIVSTTLYFMLHRNEWDVIHVHETHWIAGLGGWLGRKCGIPVVCKEASYPPMAPLAMPVPFKKKWDLERRQNHIIALNQAIESRLLEENIPADRITVVPNGVSVPDRAASVGMNRDVLFIGNFSQESWKAFDILFSAWRIVSKERTDSKLIVLGGGERSAWERYVHENDMQHAVDFVGFVQDIEPYVMRSACLVLPSRVEGMSNALLEAMSYGVPAIVSDIQANISVVRDAEIGIVVPVEDADALARAITQVLDLPEKRQQMGAAARKAIKENYSLAAVADRLLVLYGKRGLGGVPGDRWART